MRYIDNEYEYSSGYYTTNKWIDNNTIVAAKSKDFHNSDTCYVALNVNNFNEKLLIDDAGSWSEYFVFKNRLIYTKGNTLFEYRIDEQKQKIIYTSLSDESLVSPHITNDGRYISFYQTINKVTGFYVFDTETGKCSEVCKKSFEEPFYYANHGMVNPENSRQMFFAHEGTTYYVSNRLWIADEHGMRNIAKQRLDDAGNLGDCFGHEMWAPDGKGLYFVKYPCSPLKPTGICYVDVNSGEYELLFSKYNYWHVGVSADGTMLAADTLRDGYSEVVVIDLLNKTEKCIAEVKTNWTHPCHPHPQFSPDKSKVCFTVLDERGRTSMGIVDITEG